MGIFREKWSNIMNSFKKDVISMYSTSYLGKKRRLDKIISNGHLLVVPVDDSLIFGPFYGLDNLASTINSIVSSKPSAILGYRGSYSLLTNVSNGAEIPFIYNITASTTTGNHVQKIKSGTVQEALTMGADCIAVHVNYCSEYENDMIHNFANIVSEADVFGMPVLAIAYPRKKHIDGTDDNFESEKNNDIDAYTRRICRCVRTSVELGADIVKTQFTGSVETFQDVIRSALGKPVIVAGGPMLSVHDSYKMAREAIKAGAAGISFGRNVFNQEHIEAYLAGMKAIVFDDVSVEDALTVYWGAQNV